MADRNVEQLNRIRNRTKPAAREEPYDFTSDQSLHSSGLPQSQVNRIFDENSSITILDRQSPGDLMIPKYWSRQRDKCLRMLAIGNDYILIALYNIIIKTVAIPLKIQSIDTESEEDVATAAISQDLLNNHYEDAIIPWLFDVMSCDNGGFMEVLSSGGRSSSPLPPMEIAPGVFIPASGLRVLDSLRCTRTGNKTYPVIYESSKGKKYKFHYTRIIEHAQLASSDSNLNGVGICAVSRVLRNALQSSEQDSILLDMLVDGMVSEIIMTKPFNNTQIETAFQEAQERAKEPGRPRYRRQVFLSVQNFKDNIQVERIPLRRLPENFSKTEYVTLMLSLLAAAIGEDARELFPQTTSGATRADAISQARKARQKFIRFFLNFMVKQLDLKFTPQTAKTGHDFVDPEEVFQQTEARKLLDEAHQLEIANGTITPLGAAQQLLANGYITQVQYDLVVVELERRREFEEAVGVPIYLPEADTLHDPENNTQNQAQGGQGGTSTTPNTDNSLNSSMNNVPVSRELEGQRNGNGKTV